VKDPSELKELTIDRAQWGVGEEGGYLYNSATKKMCCLGFLALACGQREADIIGCMLPRDGTVPTGFYAHLSAARANDDRLLAQKDREARIKSIFAARGIRVKFIGSLKPRKAPAERE
jgi:hypothetical protein